MAILPTQYVWCFFHLLLLPFWRIVNVINDKIDLHIIGKRFNRDAIITQTGEVIYEQEKKKRIQDTASWHLIGDFGQ